MITESPNVSAPILLELFNGGALILEGLFLLWALRYLWLESKRRNLRIRDWFYLPPSMSLVVAVIVFDFSSWLRSLVVWSWRRFYEAGAFQPWHTDILLAAGAIGVLGALCKIRAVTKPDYGSAPWLFCTGLIVVYVVMSLLTL